jgi:DHA1 family bicyclomycin/chloramphenicol resistance-like MFS transporter
MPPLKIQPDTFAFTVLLGLLAALPSISIDITIPTLLTVQSDFRAQPGVVGQTITVFMVGFAFGQFAAGPLSDRYGRRPTLLAGLTAYSVAAAGCAIAGGIGPLLAGRLVQGIAAGACSVMAFTIIRDLFDGDAARSKRSYVTVVFGLAPMLAPTLGAWMMGFMGWRSIFLVLGTAGFLLLVAIVFGVDESRPRQSVTAGHSRLLTAYGTVLRNPRFTALAIVNALSFGAIFAYIAGSSVVMMGSLHLTAQVYAAFFACTAASLASGAWVSGRAAKANIGPATLVWIGLSLAAVTAIALCVLIEAHILVFAILIPLLLVNLFSRGLVAPNVQHMALEPMRENAGTAAATIGVMQILTGAAASALVATALPALGPFGMTIVMAVFASAAFALWLLAMPRPTLGRKAEETEK